MEQRVIDTLRNVFELNGFIGIETRAVEQGSSLLKKGETSKEIYLLSRLQEVGHESDTPIEDRLGLHFDLTVPLSRYVVEHSGDLAFPFKRWQIQKVWRGERPQEGRFREFVQADIDVIGNGDLPDHYEVELPLVMVSALERLREFGLPKATVHANNRKLSEGFYRGLGLTDIEGVLREIDKLDKIGADATGLPFNSIMAILLENDHPSTPLVNAGAISACSMIKPTGNAEAKWKAIVDFISGLCGSKVSVLDELYRSESETNFNNRSIAWLLKSYNRIYDDPDMSLDLYTRQCSLGITAKQLAVMALSLIHI